MQLITMSNTQIKGQAILTKKGKVAGVRVSLLIEDGHLVNPNGRRVDKLVYSDAHLIAAAPDLLVAAIEIEQVLSADQQGAEDHEAAMMVAGHEETCALCRLRAAIAKAKGERHE